MPDELSGQARFGEQIVDVPWGLAGGKKNRAMRRGKPSENVFELDARAICAGFRARLGQRSSRLSAGGRLARVGIGMAWQAEGSEDLSFVGEHFRSELELGEVARAFRVPGR